MNKKYAFILATVFFIIGTALVSYTAVSSSKMEDADIKNIWWNVTEINGTATLHPDRFRVKFDNDGRVGGKSGCNNFGGGYELQGNRFKPTSPFFGTKMMCYPETVMEEEYNFLTSLEKMTHIDIIDENTIRFSGTDNTSLVFVIEQDGQQAE